MGTSQLPSRRHVAPARPGRIRRTAGVLMLTSVLCGIEGGPSYAAVLSPPPAGSSSWPVYHGDPAGTGAAAPVTAVHTGAAVWASPAVDGQIYGEPLVSAGRVYVATENDTVYALSAATGAVVWSTHLGRPVPAASLPCGDIRPTVGITGTPVIDTSRGEIFVVADELACRGGAPTGRPEHDVGPGRDEPGRGPAGGQYGRAAAAHRAGAGRRSGGVRLRRQRRGLRQLPGPGGGRSRDGRPRAGLHRRRRAG